MLAVTGWMSFWQAGIASPPGRFAMTCFLEESCCADPHSLTCPPEGIRLSAQIRCLSPVGTASRPTGSRHVATSGPTWSDQGNADLTIFHKCAIMEHQSPTRVSARAARIAPHSKGCAAVLMAAVYSVEREPDQSHQQLYSRYGACLWASAAFLFWRLSSRLLHLVL